MATEYPGVNMESLYQFGMSTTPVEDPLRAEKSAMLWNPFFNIDAISQYCSACGGGVGQCCSTKGLLMDDVEKK